MLLSSFEWGYEKNLRSWVENFSEWMVAVPLKYKILVGIVVITVFIVIALSVFSSEKEEVVFTPPPTPEPWPVPHPVEPIEEEPVEEDEFDRMERELDTEAMKKLKNEAKEQRALLEIENKHIDLKNKEEMLRRKEKDIELKTRYGL